MNIKNLIQKQFSRPFASNVGSTRFRLTMDKENVKTPHYIMRSVEDMLENRTSLFSNLRQLALFIMPELKFHSSDEKTAAFANEWLNMRDDMEREIFNFVFLFLGSGNAYFEPSYINLKNSNKTVIDNLRNVPIPSGVYYNLNRNNDDEYWIIEYPLEVVSVEGQKLAYRKVNYVLGSFTWRGDVWGMTLHKDKLKHLKFLWSRSPFYGSGLLSSAIDNEAVAEEILKNWQLAAKYRSLSKKIMGFYNEDGSSVDPNELEDIKEDLANLEEEDSLLVNKRIDVHDLTFTGSDNMMQSELEFLRRDSGSSVVPNYMTAFSQDSSLATASEAKIPFALSVDSVQNLIEGFLNNLITKSLKEAYDFLDDDLVLKLGKPQLYSRNEDFMNVQQLYNMRAATFNELRIAAGKEPVEGGDIWGREPPLDNEKIEHKDDKHETRVEKLKKDKTFKEKLKLIEQPEPFKERVMKVKPKENDLDNKSKEKSFSEAVKHVLLK